MSMALSCLGNIFPFISASAVALSVWTGVRGWEWPSSAKIFLMCTASRALMKSAASSASEADDMTDFITCAIVKIAPLLGGCGSSFYRKKCPPAQLLALLSLK